MRRGRYRAGVAHAGQTVENPRTGERVTFVRTASDTGGELLEIALVWPRPGRRAGEHVHPEMEERYEVLSGTAAFRIDRQAEFTAGPGEVVTVPPGTPHLAWNPTGAEVRLKVEFRPALRWEEFVVRLFAGEEPLPDLMREFRREIAAPPPQAA
jgi:mannose-6-phosphate isomerase-like protein (cupin superfamily)